MSTEVQITLEALGAGVAVVIVGWVLLASWRHVRRYVGPDERIRALKASGIAVAAIASSILVVSAAWSPGSPITPLGRVETTLSRPSSVPLEPNHVTTVGERNPERMKGALDSKLLPGGSPDTASNGGTEPDPNPGGGSNPPPDPAPEPQPSPSPSPSPEPPPSPSPSPEPSPEPSPSDPPEPTPDPCEVLPLPGC